MSNRTRRHTPAYEGDTDYKLPISISLPQSIVRRLDEERGHLTRSAYILLLLDRVLRECKAD